MRVDLWTNCISLRCLTCCWRSLKISSDSERADRLWDYSEFMEVRWLRSSSSPISRSMLATCLVLARTRETDSSRMY